MNKIKNWEYIVNKHSILFEGVNVLKRLKQIGVDNNIKNPEAFIVGGAVRDIIIGDFNEYSDIDIATNIPIDIIDINIKNHTIGSNKDFGVIVINSNGFEFEVAQYRAEGEYRDSRHPDTVDLINDIKIDASRRDLTINSLYVDDEGNIIDYFDGQKDIKNKVIRTVGDAHKRFSEDYIRMLRAVRFGSRLGFDIEAETLKAIKDNAGKLEGQAKERIMKEVYKMAEQDGSKFADALVTLKDVGLLDKFLPEIVEMDEYEHEVEHHPEGNVFQHVMATVRNTGSKDAIINLSALLHDVGKIDTHSLDENGKHKYFMHAKRSGEMIEDIAARLKMSSKDKKALQFAAVNHMKMHSILDMSDSKIIKLIDDENWDVLEKVALADSKARGELFSQDEWDKTVAKIEEVKARFSGAKAVAAIKKAVSGKMVMDAMGITKGNHEVGRIHGELIDWIVNNDIDYTDVDVVNNKIKDLI